MPTTEDDVKLTEDQKTEWNGVGDATIIRNVNRLVQSISISALQGYQNVNASLTAQSVEEMRGGIEQRIRANQNTREPIEVVVDEIDWENSTVMFDISTARVSLTESASL